MDIEETIKRVRTGDTTALKKLIEAYSPMLRKVCFNITHEDEDTLNDLVQVAFIRAYYSLHQLRDASKFGEWVSAIAKNEALRFRKCKQKGSVVPFSSFSDEELDVEGSITPENYLGEKEIMKMVHQLPTGYSKVFQMAVIEGYSHKEIAERMGIEPHSSSSQLARAKAMLRKMISKRMLAVVTIIFISIPICRVLWRKDKAKEKNNHTAQVKNEDKGQTSLGNRQVEEKQATKDQITKDQSQKDKEVDVVISNIYPHVVQAIVDTIPATDMLQTPNILDNIHLAGIIDDSIFCDTIKIRWHEYDKPLITEETALPKKHHWQLLAAGSLGSALAQNAYRMLTGNSGGGLPDVDGPDGPVAPDKFSTWDEYYRYLQIKEHEGLSEEEKALMEIAFNNKNNINNNIKNDGKIVEHEHHDKPITFGISVTKTLGEKWSMMSGLQYSLLKSNFTLGEDAYYIKRTQHVHYLGIPLHVSYKWLDVKNWTIYSSLGGSLQIPVYGKTDEKYVVGPITPCTNHWHFIPSLQWSVSTGIGVQYKLATKWSVYIEPSLHWYVPNGSSVHTIWTEHPFTFTVPFGLRFTW